MTITKAKAPQGVFSTSTPIAEGLVIPPGDSAFQNVTFSPVATGQAGTPDTYYLVTADDGQGAQEVMLTGNGVADPIAVKAQQLGAGQTWQSFMGQALSGEYAVAGGQCEDYTNGVICWSPSTGTHEVHGGIYAEYKALGGPAGFLGLPVTDELGTPDGVGRYNHFSGPSVGGASIYYTPATGAHEVQGGIRAKWASLGWEQGPLGYPVTDELGTPDGIGRYNHFSGPSVGGASIYYTPATGAHEVHGAIRATWASLGWEQGPLGYPVTDEYSVPLGRESDFSRGRLVWNARTGAVTG